MPKFVFRLEKVLEHRAFVEAQAKEAFLETRASRLESEAVAASIQAHRERLVKMPLANLDERLAMERSMLKLDDDERTQDAVTEVLKAEEGQALGEWQERKKDLETLVKLKQTALTEHELKERRKDQSDLDEWSVLRRQMT